MLPTASSLSLTGPLTLGSARPVSRPGRQPATGPPGSYPDRTSTGRRRRAYEHEGTPWHYVTVSPPALLGAHDNPSPAWGQGPRYEGGSSASHAMMDSR